MTDSLIRPDWPAPKNVMAVSSTRNGGVSARPYNSLNLGDHVGDNPENIAHNREHLITYARLPAMPLWLRQTHSTIVVNSQDWQPDIEADALISTERNRVCAVMTADCLPVLLCNFYGTEVAAIHAGWRGLCDGILERTVATLSGPSEDYLAWLGPAIGPDKFEVGEEVRSAYIAHNGDADKAFTATHPGFYLANIYQLARQRLQAIGINNIYGGDFCTASQSEKFFSYRRDGVTGRMASLIWLMSE